MATPKQPFFKQPFVKGTVIAMICLSLGVAGLYAWYVNNAKKLFIGMVAAKSGGRFTLELSSVRVDLLSGQIEIRNARVLNTDSVGPEFTYRVRFKKLLLRADSFWPLLFKRPVTFKQVALYDPEIDVYKWTSDSAASANNMSIPHELGKIYKTINVVIAAINSRSLVIDNATLRMVNKMRTASQPVVFSNIYFELNTDRDRDVPGQPLRNASTIVLRSSRQDIMLYDGRHKLVFKKLELRQDRNSIELDSCTIAALPSNGSKSSYTIYFEKLALVGLGFDTLYKTNLIRADSVYCEKPVFVFNLNSSFTDSTATEGRPDLEKIIRDLSGNLDLGFVGVRDAGININITGKRTRSILNSRKDNFQIRRFRVNPDSSRPVSVKSFDMLVQGYQLYNADSSCRYSFDSIRFAGNRLLLSNFSVLTASGRNKIRPYRDYTIPFFELSGLDWFELIFKQNVKAKEAILHSPVIKLKLPVASKSRKSHLFYSLDALDDVMAIRRLRIINGEFTIKWGRQHALQLNALNISAKGDDLGRFANKLNLQEGIDSFLFSRATIATPGGVASILDMRYNAEEHIKARQLFIHTSSGDLQASMNGISIRNVHIEPDAGNIIVDGLEWRQGNVAFKRSPGALGRLGGIPLEIRNVSGNQTGVTFVNGTLRTGALIVQLKMISLSGSKDGRFKLQGFSLTGTDLKLDDTSLHVDAAAFYLSDSSHLFSRVNVIDANDKDSLTATIPRVQISADVNALAANHFSLDTVLVMSPLIRVAKHNSPAASRGGPPAAKSIQVGHIVIHEPVIQLAFGSNVNIGLPDSPGSKITMGDVQRAGTGITIGSLAFQTTSVYVDKGRERLVNITDGAVNLAASAISLSQPGEATWQGTLNKLDIQNPGGLRFVLNENIVHLNDLSLGNLRLSSSNILAWEHLVKANNSAWIRTGSVEYSGKSATLKGFNASYHADMLAFDSIKFRPVKSQEAFIASTPHQADYIRFHFGQTKMTGMDLVRLAQQGALFVRNASIANARVTIYRDKLPPFLAGVIKPLPVVQIRNIPLPVSIDRIDVSDGMVSYTERQARTRKEAIVSLSHLNGHVSNIRNHDVTAGDSLWLAVSGNLMDSVFFALALKESYTDPLGGFLMQLKVNPASFTSLNPLLAPLSNVKFTSGTIDSLLLTAVGKEYSAAGKMSLYYRNLRIRLLSDGDLAKSSLLKRGASGLINTFVVKTHNRKRTGLVYFKRLRDRSVFNYIVKMTFSGIATSIGVKKNAVYRRAYRVQSDVN